MSHPITTTGERAIHWSALRVLYSEAVHGHGWLRRGVRGWRFYREMQVLTGKRLADALPPLVHKGLADRIDVRYPGRQKPEWIYRITPAGVDAVAHLLPGSPAPLPAPAGPDPGAGSIYLPSRVWSVAQDLRERARLDAGLKRFGVPGWMRISELNHPGRARISNELAILAELGLAQRRETDAIHGGRRLAVWRITARGAALRVIDAAPVGSEPPRYVQLRPEKPAGPTARQVDRAGARLTAPDPHAVPGVLSARGPGGGEVDGVDTGPGTGEDRG